MACFTSGSKIKIDGLDYIIIGETSDELSLYRKASAACGRSSFDIRPFSKKDVLTSLANGTIDILPPEEKKYLNENSLSKPVLNKYLTACKFIGEIIDAYGPTFSALSGHKKKREFDEIRERYGLSKHAAWSLIKKYFENGENLCSLVDHRYLDRFGRKIPEFHKRPGRKAKYHTPSTVILNGKALEAIKWGFDYYINHNDASMDYTYIKMLSLYYSDHDGFLIPISERPTKKQFTNYLKKHLTSKELLAREKDPLEFRNDHRALRGSLRDTCPGPGRYLLLDALELDAYCRGKIYSDSACARPTAYFLYDVYSGMIVGFSVSFKNNAVEGITNCLFSLIADRNKLFRQISEEEANKYFPAGAYPSIIYSDNGSDDVSNAFNSLCNQMHIEHDTVPPKMGSYKGGVERSFRSFLTSMRPALEDKGTIHGKKDYEDPRVKAELTIDDFADLVANFVIAHNRSYNPSFRLDKVQREGLMNGTLNQSRIGLYQFGCALYGGPRKIADENLFRLQLLLPIRVKGCKEGLKYDNYLNYDVTGIPEFEDIPYKVQNKLIKRSELYFDALLDSQVQICV
jgi:putative transposase